MPRLCPYVRLNDGKCREAMNFYKDCLGGELHLMTIGESPMAKEMPSDKQNLIMHSTLKSDNLMLIGSDTMRDRAITGDQVGISLECKSEEELREVFGKLAKDGDVFMPIEEQFWGGVFGVVTDKYGVEWMLNYQKKPMSM